MEDYAEDWNRLWGLENKVQQGDVLLLTDDVRALLLRTSPTVAIDEAEAEAGLATSATATALLLKIRARIRDGSHRLTKALHRMEDLEKAKDFEGARQQMRVLLAVEVVPLYREIATSQLKKLDLHL